MELTAEAFKLYTWLFSSIWMRKPVIILSSDLKDAHEHIARLLPIIPRYRRFYISGIVPQRFPVWLKNPNIFTSNDAHVLEKSILSSFDEEKHASGYTLQLINFNTSEIFFRNILTKIDRGWIAFSTIRAEQLTEIFENYSPEFRHLGKCTFIFLNSRPRKINVEAKLMRTYMSGAKLPTQNLIQRKMEEIRYSAEYLVSEIENGHYFYQAEIQELFGFDHASFEKCLDLIQTEFHIDVKRYIRRTSTKMKRLQNKIMKLKGVLYVATLKNNQILGIKKAASCDKVPMESIKEFNRFIQDFADEFGMDAPDRLLIDFKRNTKFIAIVSKSDQQEQSLFCFFLDNQTPVASFLREADEVIKKEWHLKYRNGSEENSIPRAVQ
ncbi:hypothetical protein GF337_00135 [candidate division KSB1 bacterium]|nr:hypothetical protein [candidate division KSB1 bacterium]